MDQKMTTKDKVLYLLKENGEISMKDLASHFTISDIAIRKHVQSLIWDGFIQKRKERQEIGRPYHLYSLTDKGHRTFPNQYEHLSVELLADLQVIEGKKVVENLLKYRQQREEEEIANQLSNDDFDEKVLDLIRLQEEKGYMINYKKLDNGDYEINIFNCPIYNLASEYHQVCDNEETMYNNLFPNSNVSISSYLTKGANRCAWTISKDRKAETSKTGT